MIVRLPINYRFLAWCLGAFAVFGMAITIFPAQAEASFYTPEYPIRASDFSLVRREGIYHLFYTVNCFEANAICDDTTIGYATSPDLTNWTRHANVLENGSGFDADEMWAPEVIEWNGKYYLFYTGVDFNGTVYVQKIGLATSNDLVTWEKHPGSPIVNCDNFSWAYWDESTPWRADCRDAGIFWDSPNNRWIMSISGRPTADPTRMIVGLASSTDLITWTELGTVQLTMDASHITESANMVYRDGQYLLHWTGATGAFQSTSASPTSGFNTAAVIDDNVGFATEIRHIDGIWVYAEAYSPELHFQELIWGSGVAFTIGELPYGSINGKVFRDADGDGTFDTGESGIGSVTAQLYTDDGDGVFEPGRADFQVDSKTTSSTGDYAFATVVPEPFWVLLPSSNGNVGQPLFGMIRTSGITSPPYFGNPLHRTVARSTASSGVDFGYIAAGSIQGTLWNDADRDGVEESGETGFANVTVNLTGTEGTNRSVFRQTTSTSTGTFTFSTLYPGMYTVTVSDLTGILGTYALTSGTKENISVDTAGIALADGEMHTTADFGYASLRTISGSGGPSDEATIGIQGVASGSVHERMQTADTQRVLGAYTASDAFPQTGASLPIEIPKQIALTPERAFAAVGLPTADASALMSTDMRLSSAWLLALIPLLVFFVRLMRAHLKMSSATVFSINLLY